MNAPIDLPGVRIVTVSGRIASGSTTLAKELAALFQWRHIEGGEIFWEAVRKKMGLDPKDTDLRPDQEDELFDTQLKKILQEDSHVVLETKLAGFNAQGIVDIFKILVICEDKQGADQPQVRIDRLVNREKVAIEKAKEEVLQREQNDIAKWRRLYGGNDAQWVYWDRKYYDLVVNTFDHNQADTLQNALQALHFPLQK